MHQSENDTFIQNGCDYFWEIVTRMQKSANLEPIKVACTKLVPNKPSYFGEEFHGKLSKEREKELLEGKVGRYLVRESFANSCLHMYTLAFNYNNTIRHIKLIFNPETNKFRVDSYDKEYSTVQEIMTDIIELFSSLKEICISERKKSYWKPHSFKMVSYKYPKWCDHCNHFLLGFFNQGFKCEDCNINVHQACQSTLVPCSKTVVSMHKLSKRVIKY
ncbi:N-chimaerin-like [Hydra vulgaris]|uniref:N-chimaerin-like n=1 Tax=Hydra vulgaris TaxID=6087 RepID=A0ABM4BN26_HYDVU